MGRSRGRRRTGRGQRESSHARSGRRGELSAGFKVCLVVFQIALDFPLAVSFLFARPGFVATLEGFLVFSRLVFINRRKRASGRTAIDNLKSVVL